MPIDAAGLRSIKSLKRALQKMPFTATARIAARAAPAMSELAGKAYAGGQTVYGRPRPLSVEGKKLKLERTGATKRALSFVATGRDVRTTKLPRYAKYLIGPATPGKQYTAGAGYGILPNGPLPLTWRERLREIAARVLYDELHRGGSP